ncbi:MAG TPA: hypothetical protein VN965_01785 [Candidatus Dormibacteraeota bacterium]|nr:hypothetical protein [Candidatus Dormibacteraeota bacterium]
MNAAPIVAILAVLATTPSPSPSPTASEAPLREIGRVHVTTPLCKTLATHAVVAADLALEDDRKIVFTVGTLRSVDFDKSIITKTRGTRELVRQFVALRAGAVQGEAEMKKFREALKEVTNDEQRAALEKFANALDGALYRQKKLAEDLGRYIAWLDAQGEPMTDQQRADIEKNIYMNQSNPNVRHNPFGDYNMVPETITHSAKRAADELVIRATLIDQDEDTAAERIDPAFKAC